MFSQLKGTFRSLTTWQIIKLLLLLAAFALCTPAEFERIISFDGLSAALPYVFLLALCWIGILCAAFIRNAIFRWFWAIVFAAGGVMMDIFQGASQQFMTYDAYVNMVNSSGFLGDAWAQNSTAFLAAIPMLLLQFFGIGLRPPPKPAGKYWQSIFVLAPLMVVGVLTAVLFIRGGDGGRGLPGGMVASPYSLLFVYENMAGEVGERQPVSLPQAEPPKYRHIVLIVDESIAAEYLDINARHGVPTPLSQPSNRAEISNFGVAASIAGCSVGSNVTLRYGGTRGDYQRIIATQPSIWAYAKQAGLRSIYVDGQRNKGMLQNRMDVKERAEIDEFIQFDDVPVVDRDQAIADRLIDLLDDPEPKFIYVNKVGAHFPVAAKYPEDRALHQPALPRGNLGDITDTGDFSSFSGSSKDWRLYRNSYRNTVSWNVGAFFKKLLSRAQLSNALILYTSDHGQFLHEKNKPGLTTHCSPEPTMSEGAVPLLAISPKRSVRGGGEEGRALVGVGGTGARGGTGVSGGAGVSGETGVSGGIGVSRETGAGGGTGAGAVQRAKRGFSGENAGQGGFTGNDNWEKWARENYNHSSHYMIFPTILGAMGYDRAKITPLYGRSLLEPSQDPMTFNTLFNARLNREPEWLEVVPKSLPLPPEKD